MISVVHTKQGKSFLGLTRYLLEGEKGQENPDRVAWTQTRNLGTDRPMTAARVMAATALDQDRLKGAAGIKNTGRKSKNHVLHYTLSWAEGQEVTPDQMMAAVEGSLSALGEKAGKKGGRGKKNGRTAVRDQFATEHQVLVVAHNDTPGKEHVHVVVNRVHPEHGVMLPSSNDFKRLSRWAERYERENGGIIVDKRAINNAARDRHETVFGQKRVPRDVYELEGGANDNRPPTARLRQEQRQKDAKLAKHSAELRASHKQEWAELAANHQARKRDHQAAFGGRIRKAMQTARDLYTNDFATLYYEHRVATEAFKRNEERLAGKAINALKAVLSLKAPVNVLWSQGARKVQLALAQAQQERELEARQREAVERARDVEIAKLNAERVRLTHVYNRERAELIIKQRAAKAELREKWKTRESERKQAWEAHRREMAALPPDKRYGVQTLEPDEVMKKAADQHMERMRKRREERDRNQGRDDNRGR